MIHNDRLDKKTSLIIYLNLDRVEDDEYNDWFSCQL